MTGPKSLASWQKKQVRLVEALRERDDFKSDIKSLPSADFETRFSALLKIEEKYGLSYCTMLLDRYAKTDGDIDPSLVMSGMSIICDDDETAGPTDSVEYAKYLYTAERGFSKPGIQIYAPPETTVSELISFIQTNKEYVESKLTELNRGAKPKGARKQTMAERDSQVMNLHNKGCSPRDIKNLLAKDDAFEYALTSVDIKRIIKRKS